LLALLAGIGLGLVLARPFIINAWNYPRDVRQTLRQALLQEKHRNEPELAIRLYRRAWRQAEAAGMNMAGPAATGILIALGGLLEQQAAKSDTPRWRHEAVEAYGTAFRTILHAVSDDSEAGWERLTTDQHHRLLGLAQKLGDLYSADRETDEAAERYYVWSLMHVMRASNRPPDTSTSTLMELPSWVSNTDFIACLDALARFYSERELYRRALPIYQLALRRWPISSDDCQVSSLLCHLADAAVGVGDLAQAKEATEQGLTVARRGRGGICQAMRGALLFNRARILQVSYYYHHFYYKDYLIVFILDAR
jgi:tetratricopeptide (TPR) repeat protein